MMKSNHSILYESQNEHSFTKIRFWSTYPCTMLYAAKEGAVQEKAAIQIKRFNRNKVCAFILCTCYPHLSYST